ncbi:hypothetical protein [Fibrella aquatica]|uniref:hypothetical protein n=1 Tax=Fibrella aquatica TaxID=3242487 RepID=UPI003522295A
MKPASFWAALSVRKRAGTRVVRHSGRPYRHTIWVVFMLVGCQTETRITAERVPAFYHWKATFNPTASDQATLDSLGVQTLYVRFFDVDWDAAARTAVPKATTIFRQKATAGMRVIPVVYITNRTVANLTGGNPAEAGRAVPELAKNLTQKIRQLAQKQHISIDEIQIDCDWTRSTRGTYFSLLTAISREANVPLSATIRLHQVKFAAKTGVPPVARGMLMSYNTGDWKQTATRNSILDLTDLQAYTDYLPGYPLPLDIALPLFRWTVVYRNDRFLTLLNNVDRAQVRTVVGLTQQADSVRYVATRDVEALGTSLRRGDILRTEACSIRDLTTARDLLLAQLPDQKRTFTLYHLDSIVLHPYTHANLKTLLHRP